MDHPFLPIAIFLLVAFVVPIAALPIARVWMNFFTPIKPGKEKNALYECGLEPISGAPARFHPRYYLFGLLFLLFDVETIFLLPFAVAFLTLSAGSFLVAMVFLLLLAEGLLWAWSRGMLQWRPQPATQHLPHGD